MFSEDTLREFYAGFFNEWYGNDYSEDFKTCFNPDKSLMDATAYALLNVAKGSQDLNTDKIAGGNIEIYDLFAKYQDYWGQCPDQTTLSEAHGWYEEWQKKGEDEIKAQALQDVGIGKTQIAAKAKIMYDSVSSGDFKAAGDAAAWINFIVLPHVYPGKTIPHPEGGDDFNIAVMHRLLGIPL